jgi:simple sugar transport system permease protein
MSDIFSYNFISGFLASLLRVATPILIVAMGELVAEHSGVVNLGIEGIMLVGAFSGFYLCFTFNSLWVGVLGAMLCGGVLGYVMAFISVKWKANQIVTGIGVWIFCLGFVGFASRKAFGITSAPPTVTGLSSNVIPLLSKIPLIGPIFFAQNVIVYLSWVAVVLIYLILKYTTWGLKLKAVGEDPAVAVAAGVNYALVRYVSVAFGGAMAGLGGAMLSLNVFHFFTHNMTTGMGFIAVAVVFFGRWRPFGVLIGSFLFSTASALQYRLQAMHFPLPYQVLLMLPYVTTLLILILFVRGNTGGPASLGAVYKEEKGGTR